MGRATRLSDEADPRRTQHRIATAPDGHLVAVEITGDDRLKLIKSLPHRWPEVMMARERGDTIEQIHRWAHCSEEDLRQGLVDCYAWLETELHDLAARRAKLLS